MKTICELIKELKNNSKIKEDEYIIGKLDEINNKANKMEDRLLKYCNAIEDLGFMRIGRDYNKQ